MIVFAEISNKSLARNIGLTTDEQIIVMHNQNLFTELPIKQDLYNLKVERTEPIESLTNIETRFKEYFDEFSKNEVYV
jgi:hypothetical protein